MLGTIILIVVWALIGCSSSNHLTTNTVVEDYLQSIATSPNNCLTADPWWCDGKSEPPDAVEMSPCSQLVIVRQTTDYNLGTGAYSDWPRDAVVDLWRQQDESIDLRVVHAAHLPVIPIDEEEVQSLDPCTFVDRFPGSSQVLEFSNVGFSNDGEFAVMVVSTRGMGLTRGGLTGILLKWSNRKWEIADHESIELY